MLNKKYPYLVFFSFLLCACASPARRASKGAVPGAAAAAQAETVPPLSSEDKKKVEGLYYRSVGAYSNNDMDAALKYIDEISTLYPSYPPAMELLGKIKSVSGSKPAPLPKKP